MDYWVKNEVRARRDEVVASYRQHREGVAILPRTTARAVVANAAQALSDTLASLARNLRRDQAA